MPDFDPFRPEDVLLDAREIGTWDDEAWWSRTMWGPMRVVKWPRAGIVRGRQAFEVGTAAAPADRMAMWATPQAHDAKPGDGARMERSNGAGNRNTNDQVVAAMWPSPSTTLYDNANVETTAARRDAERAKGRNGNGFGLTTAQAVRDLWNTVRTADAKGSGPLRSSSQRSRLEHSQLDAQVIQATSRSGLLNPAWVETLMGYPPGWTDLDAHELATDARDAWAAWGPDRYVVGDLDGTNPDYARHWLWHPVLGDLAYPLAPRTKQTKDRLIALGNSWVPQCAAPILARIASVLA